MTYRGLFLADGSSDLPIAGLLRHVCSRHGVLVEVVPVPNDRLPLATSRTVHARVQAALGLDPDFSLVFVHRDAEGEHPDKRKDEVAAGVLKGGFSGPAVAVVPVRMTEAWLLLDEAAIREVAGRPSGNETLSLPRPDKVEELPDPKATLREALCVASGTRGRRREMFLRRFPELRRVLLDRLDPDGPVTGLPAWRRLEVDVRAALSMLDGTTGR